MLLTGSDIICKPLIGGLCFPSDWDMMTVWIFVGKGASQDG